MRVGLALVLLLTACADDAGYATNDDPEPEVSLLVGTWKATEGDRTVTLAIDAELHMVATLMDGAEEQVAQYDLSEQEGDLVTRDRVRVTADVIEDRRSTQSYFVDFELFLPLALRKTDATEHAEGVYLARDLRHVELDGELVLKSRTEVVLMLEADGTWVRTATDTEFFDYNDAGDVRFLDPPLVVESQTRGTWEVPGARQLRLIESTGSYDVTLPFRQGHLPSDDIFWRQPN